MNNVLIEVINDSKYGKIAHFLDYKNKHVFAYVIESELGVIYKEVELEVEDYIKDKLDYNDELYNVGDIDEDTTK